MAQAKKISRAGSKSKPGSKVKRAKPKARAGSKSKAGSRSTGAKERVFTIVGVVLDQHDGFIAHVRAKNAEAAVDMCNERMGDLYEGWDIGAVFDGKLKPSKADQHAQHQLHFF